MDEQENQIEELSPEPRQGSGSILAAARKAQQRTIEEIASELNLSVSQIKTIELDQTDGLPEPTYVRGYIRGYAKLLGLKPEEVLHNYLDPNWQKSSSLNDIPRGIGSAEDRGTRFFSAGKLIALILIVLIAAVLWYTGVVQQVLSGSDSVQAGNDEEQVVEAVRGVTAGFESELEETNADEEPVSSDSTTTAQSEQSSPEGQSGEATELSPASSDDRGSNVISMRFTATSWVDIRDGNDERLAYKSYTDGDTLEIEEAGEMRVFIGNAEGVSVELNGQPYALTPHREGVYAKFVIAAVQ